MAVQRRIIWLDDETWQELVEQGASIGMNPSRFIAYGLRRGARKNEPLAEPRVATTSGPADLQAAQKARDNILRGINKAKTK